MVKLTAAIEGLLASPAGGCVTSAPRNMTGSLNTPGLKENRGTFQTRRYHAEIQKELVIQGTSL